MSLSKQELRKNAKSIISQIPEIVFQEKCEKVSRNILSLIKKSPSLKIIGGFAPIQREVKWYLALQGFENRLAFPGIVENSPTNEMCFYKSTLEELEETREFGVTIKTPGKNKLKVIPDLLLIPGLAFTRTGNRLGRGKGFYDRYLVQFRGVKVGVCIEEQILPEIVTERHDASMNMLVTDREIIEINK